MSLYSASYWELLSGSWGAAETAELLLSSRVTIAVFSGSTRSSTVLGDNLTSEVHGFVLSSALLLVWRGLLSPTRNAFQALLISGEPAEVFSLCMDLLCCCSWCTLNEELSDKSFWTFSKFVILRLTLLACG